MYNLLSNLKEPFSWILNSEWMLDPAPSLILNKFGSSLWEALILSIKEGCTMRVASQHPKLCSCMSINDLSCSSNEDVGEVIRISISPQDFLLKASATTFSTGSPYK